MVEAGAHTQNETKQLQQTSNGGGYEKAKWKKKTKIGEG